MECLKCLECGVLGVYLECIVFLESPYTCCSPSFLAEEHPDVVLMKPSAERWSKLPEFMTIEELTDEIFMNQPDGVRKYRSTTYKKVCDSADSDGFSPTFSPTLSPKSIHIQSHIQTQVNPHSLYILF